MLKMIKIKFSHISGGMHPKLGQVFYVHIEAISGEDISRYNRYMCGILSVVAQCRDDCDRILQYINLVENGSKVQIETGGNDVSLTIRPKGVQVDIEINEEWIGQADGHFELDEWKAALVGWRQFLEMPESLESVLVIEIT
jgi:hypothetical protein